MTGGCQSAGLWVMVVAVLACGTCHAAVPTHFSQLTYAEWGQLPTEPCVHQARVATVAVDPEGLDAYTFAATVQDRVLGLCRGTLSQPDCRSAVWTQRLNARYGEFDVELCGHVRTHASGAAGTATTYGLMELCDNDGSVRILCRPEAANPVARSMRSATFGTPYTTQCEANATLCACRQDLLDAHPTLDDTCNPVPCPGGCSGHGECNVGAMTCACETGYYGEDCGSLCGWVSGINGQVCSGHGACTGPSGTCGCDEGYEGSLCDRCVAGFYGPGLDCSFQCPVVEGHHTLGFDVCGGSWGNKRLRGTCDPYQGCICRPGSFLDPRTGCGTCLPNTEWSDFHYGNNGFHTCKPLGLCRVTKHTLLGLEPNAEPNAFCAMEDSFYSTAWCTADEGEEAAPLLACSPRADVPPCNGHGTCVSPASAEVGSAIVQYRVPTMAINPPSCIYMLTETGNVMEIAWPDQEGATCGDNEGVRSAGHFTGDDTDRFTHLIRANSELVVATERGEVWTIESSYAFTTGKWEDIPYAAHAAAGDKVLGLAKKYSTPYALIGRVLYALKSDNLQATVVVALPETLIPLYMIEGTQYFSIATQSGDWWLQYINSGTALCCNVHESHANLIPVESFGDGHRAVYITTELHTPMALLTSGVYTRWDDEAREWSTHGEWGQNALGYYVGPSDALLFWFEGNKDTAQHFGGRALDLAADKRVVDAAASTNNDFIALHEDGTFTIWGDAVPSEIVDFDPKAITGLTTMAAHPMATRFYTTVVVLDMGAGGAGSATASSVLGASVVVANPHTTLEVVQTCMCDTGWAGAFCTVPLHCNANADRLSDVACLSGLAPGEGYNPSLDLVLASAGASGTAAAPGHVRPLATPPPLPSRVADTRVHVLRQREVHLDLTTSYLRITGTTDVDARRYTPARAEYLCYRAHRAGRLLHTLDIASLRPADLQALARELDNPTSGPPTSDGLFWVRGDGTSGGYAYTAHNKALQSVRTYVDAEPTVVANVVCAYDEDTLLDTPPTVDAYARCKLPAWFCHLWETTSALSYCGWMGSDTAQ